ncbi:MAG: hypothetical protein ABI411_07090 [Tahibacter sp.]
MATNDKQQQRLLGRILAQAVSAEELVAVAAAGGTQNGESSHTQSFHGTGGTVLGPGITDGYYTYDGTIDPRL